MHPPHQEQRARHTGADSVHLGPVRLSSTWNPHFLGNGACTHKTQRIPMTPHVPSAVLAQNLENHWIEFFRVLCHALLLPYYVEASIYSFGTP